MFQNQQEKVDSSTSFIGLSVNKYDNFCETNSKAGPTIFKIMQRDMQVLAWNIM